MIRLYFYGPRTTNAGLRRTYQTVKTICERSLIELSSNTETREANLPSETISAYNQSGAPLLDAMQAVIVEATTSDPQIGYLLAYALAEKRPLLLLYTRGESAPDVLRYVSQRDVPKHVTIASYTERNLEAIVGEFLRTLGDVPVREVPRIKFTLRLTRTIDDFLEFKTRHSKLSKADFLRDQLERMIEQDQAFQAFLKKRP